MTYKSLNIQVELHASIMRHIAAMFLATGQKLTIHDVVVKALAAYLESGASHGN